MSYDWDFNAHTQRTGVTADIEPRLLLLVTPLSPSFFLHLLLGDAEFSSTATRVRMHPPLCNTTLAFRAHTDALTRQRLHVKTNVLLKTGTKMFCFFMILKVVVGACGTFSQTADLLRLSVLKKKKKQCLKREIISTEWHLWEKISLWN